MLIHRLPPDPFVEHAYVLCGTTAELNTYSLKHHKEKLIEKKSWKAYYCSYLPMNEKEALTHYLCIVTDRSSRQEREALLVHEIVHFVFAVFDHLGISARRKNDEVFAYYYEWIYAHAIKAIRR